MTLLNKLWAIFSSISSLFAGLVGCGVTDIDRPYIEVSGKTKGSFTTNTPLHLAEDAGWADWAPHFTKFHLQPEWYKGTISKLKKEMAASSDLRLWFLDPESYHFAGGTPISGKLECPRQTYCLMTAGRQDSAWVIERILFTKQRDQVPLRIINLLSNLTNAGSSHYLFVKGPREGKLLFNQMSLGILLKRTTLDQPFNILSFVKLIPLYLPSGLPDGVISFE
ncbi:hypothetical protein DSO57_1038246 [Entomophthora muscae]|uniref:Uncharacterized protein n=1 Tax=Entomophthora muscae TaxID=34485 RepID=A0ACC2SYR1_9FUNG|nr:hypothetical protein DSO57_1038246 [Entomophthora muscae]